MTLVPGAGLEVGGCDRRCAPRRGRRRRGYRGARRGAGLRRRAAPGARVRRTICTFRPFGPTRRRPPPKILLLLHPGRCSVPNASSRPHGMRIHTVSAVFRPLPQTTRLRAPPLPSRQRMQNPRAIRQSPDVAGILLAHAVGQFTPERAQPPGSCRWGRRNPVSVPTAASVVQRMDERFECAMCCVRLRTEAAPSALPHLPDQQCDDGNCEDQVSQHHPFAHWVLFCHWCILPLGSIKNRGVKRRDHRSFERWADARGRRLDVQSSMPAPLTPWTLKLPRSSGVENRRSPALGPSPHPTPIPDGAGACCAPLRSLAASRRACPCDRSPGPGIPPFSGLM